jgi:hypothetical protein
MSGVRELVRGGTGSFLALLITKKVPVVVVKAEKQC